MIKKQFANNFTGSILMPFSGKNCLQNEAINSQRQDNSWLSKTLGVIILAVFFNLAAAINLPVQAADTAPSSNIECLFNWAQTFHSDLFSPAGSGVQFSSPYTYRYFPATNSYVGVSSVNNHVYYLGPHDVSPQDAGELSAWLAESGCGARTYPVIFIHGIGSSADTWLSYRNYLINSAGWTFGGIPTYDQINKTVNIGCPLELSQTASCTADGGDFYTLNFPDSQFFPLDIQGGGLAAIIKAVLDANPGKTKVILISHSMGGLVAREYLQGLARLLDSVAPFPYRDDVAKLITVGAPHQGTFWAEACQDDVGICDLLASDIDSNSAAVEDIRPNSPALNVLNDLITHPLPTNISYVSIVGTGQPTWVSPTRTEEGDGIVSAISQDLVRLTGFLPQQKSVRINIPFRDCGNQIDLSFIGSVGETHTCETTDVSVGAEILKDLQ